MIPIRRFRSAAGRVARAAPRPWDRSGRSASSERSDRTASSARSEREADRTADAVLEPDGTAAIPPHAGPHTAGAAPVAAPVPGVGRPLDGTLRMYLQRRLGADLSTVRVHDDPAAARAAREQHAAAYTVGEHVVLGAGADHATLAHELVHVLQQRGAGRSTVQRQDAPPRGSAGGVGSGVGRVGSAPPAVDFDVVRQRAPSEDATVLFGQDSVSLAGMDLLPLLPRLATTAPLVVDIDGYASSEGDPEYNVNLSAHRAAVVRATLLPLLPDGSTVRLHAHGATPEFGETPANRRVGIRITEAPVAPVPPSVAPPSFAMPRLLPDLQLHLDPLPPLLPPGVLPPVPDVRLQDPSAGGPPRVFEPPAPARPFSPYTPSVTLPPELLPKTPPPTAAPPQLFPWLTPQRTVVDWGPLRDTVTEHGAGAISPELAAAAEAHTRTWYERYRAAGIPEERARWLANVGTRSVVGRELAKEGNTAADRLDNELRRQGLPTPTTVGVDLFDVLRKVRGERGGKR